MSGFAAIIGFDGWHVGPGQIEKMTAAMHYRGVDGIAHWTDGPVALGHCMLRTTAESLEETQPLANEDTSAVLVMDGWLSNREELRADLLARGARLRTRSDAELVLRAYETWGEECPGRIDGEFAFLVWDARRRTAFCARDHAGLRPLHYHWDGRRLVVASDIGGVMAGPGVEQKRNRGMIAEYLANEWITRDETIWQGVYRLEGAHWMRFGADGQRGGEYWAPPFEVAIRYKRDEDYFAHYREVFADSVRRASRTHLPLACDVSGGLDSSAIFCMAHDLRRNGRLQAPAIEGFTYRYGNGAEAEDFEHACAVAGHVGVKLHEVPPFMPEASWFAERGRQYRDFAGFPNGVMAVSIGERLTAMGARVKLNGEGGDEFLTGKRLYFQEQIKALDWAALARAVREDVAQLGSRQTARNVLRLGLVHCLPEPVLAMMRRIRAMRASKPFERGFWLSPELADMLRSRREAAGRASPRIANPARRAMHAMLTYAFGEMVRDQVARQNAHQGYEARSPMYAKPFVEFAFATPERIRLNGKTRKFVHVRSLAGLIPGAVADRTTKGGCADAFSRHLDTMRGALIDLAGNGSGDLSPQGVARLYDRHYRETGDIGDGYELWCIFAIESLYAPNSLPAPALGV